MIFFCYQVYLFYFLRDDLRVVQDKLEQYTDKKLYLRATNTLCESLKLVHGELRDVTALRDIAHNLEGWRKVGVMVSLSNTGPCANKIII